MRELPRACPELRTRHLAGGRPSSGRPRPGLGLSRGGSRFAGVGSSVFELLLRALRDTAGKSRLAERGASRGERESERARVRARARAPHCAGGGEAAATTQRNGSEASEQL